MRFATAVANRAYALGSLAGPAGEPSKDAQLGVPTITQMTWTP